MKQTFIKTIKGHILEFNRLLYPIKYAILSQDVIFAGVVIVVDRDENGVWYINSTKLPQWVSEITAEIYEFIIENEANQSVEHFS